MRPSLRPGDERDDNPDDIFVEIQPNNNMRTGSVLLSNGGGDQGSPRASVRSFGSRSRYPAPNLSSAHVPLPDRLHLYKEIINDVINGDLPSLKQKLT